MEGRELLEGSLEEVAPELRLEDGSRESQERGFGRGKSMLKVTPDGGLYVQLLECEGYVCVYMCACTRVSRDELTCVRFPEAVGLGLQPHPQPHTHLKLDAFHKP